MSLVVGRYRLLGNGPVRPDQEAAVSRPPPDLRGASLPPRPGYLLARLPHPRDPDRLRHQVLCPPGTLHRQFIEDRVGKLGHGAARLVFLKRTHGLSQFLQTEYTDRIVKQPELNASHVRRHAPTLASQYIAGTATRQFITSGKGTDEDAMEPSEVQRAVEAGSSIASALGLRVSDAVVLHNSNRVVLRLIPSDVLARVRPLIGQGADDLEVEVARRLAETGGPVAELAPQVEPSVHVRDGFAVTLWKYYEPSGPSEVTPGEYAQALARLHAGLRQFEVRAPHFTDRVAQARRLIADREQTPELPGPDRELIDGVLRRVSTAISGHSTGEQILHGEPHVGNLLRTQEGLLFVDFETCCRGPIEFDIAHGLVPDEHGRILPAAEVCEHYPGASPDLVDQCRLLIWAMITTWRWQRDDQLPNRSHWRTEGLNQLRAPINHP